MLERPTQPQAYNNVGYKDGDSQLDLKLPSVPQFIFMKLVLNLTSQVTVPMNKRNQGSRGWVLEQEWISECRQMCE